MLTASTFYPAEEYHQDFHLKSADYYKAYVEGSQRYPWLDGKRVGALGASYGGYMVNWIAGNWPDRFRCLVNHDGNLDERAAYNKFVAAKAQQGRYADIMRRISRNETGQGVVVVQRTRRSLFFS